MTTNQIIKPLGVAAWLLSNTSLTFEQIANVTGLDFLEVQLMQDGEYASGLSPFDPITFGQLSWDEIKRCEQDSSSSLKMVEIDNIK